MKSGLIFIAVAAAASLLFTDYAGAGQKMIVLTNGTANGKQIGIKSHGWFEDCNKWKSGDTVKIGFSSTKPVGFSAHYHKKRSMENINIWEKSQTDRYEGSITVNGDKIYCFIWHNENPENISLTYDMSVVGR